MTTQNTSTVSLFKFNAADIRVVTLEGNPWFVAKDVCDHLGLRAAPSNGSYQNHYRRLAAEDLGVGLLPHPNGSSIRMKLVSEAGLYDLVTASKKPEAQEFKRWVTQTVLPSIRKDGGYVLGEEKVVTGAQPQHAAG